MRFDRERKIVGAVLFAIPVIALFIGLIVAYGFKVVMLAALSALIAVFFIVTGISLMTD